MAGDRLRRRQGLGALAAREEMTGWLERTWRGCWGTRTLWSRGRWSTHLIAVTRGGANFLSSPRTVRSLGTEGRKANPTEEIPANDNVYECVVVFFQASCRSPDSSRPTHSFIIFRAADVKDLKIEAPAPEAAPQPPMNDPAIVAVRSCIPLTSLS